MASPFATFTASAWADLRAATPMPLTDADIESLRGLAVGLSMEDVEHTYLPISRLLNLRVAAWRQLAITTQTFLSQPPVHVPFIVAVAGSVAVGKSTSSRILQALLAKWPDHPRVELITTDGFLHANSVLAERGLMERKGFPESYDVRRLIDCLSAIKSGANDVAVPQYSHLTYDVLDEPRPLLERPDIVIVEGLNVLQTPASSGQPEGSVFVSDYFDFKVYVDAPAPTIRDWYVDRFLALRDTAFQNSQSYFRRFGDLNDDEARTVASDIWGKINEPNLTDNILPTRERADLVLTKAADHSLAEVRLRRV